jgi:hypothetical protein
VRLERVPGRARPVAWRDLVLPRLGGRSARDPKGERTLAERELHNNQTGAVVGRSSGRGKRKRTTMEVPGRFPIRNGRQCESRRIRNSTDWPTNIARTEARAVREEVSLDVAVLLLKHCLLTPISYFPNRRERS